MLNSVTPAPVIIGPGTPISPEAWQQAHPRRPEFTVRTAGGPTQINLMWDSLLEAADHITAASSVFTQIRFSLSAVLGGLAPTAGHLHWRIPEFHAHFSTLLAATASTEQLLAQASNGAEMAHQGYRNAETTVQSWFTLLLTVSEHEVVLEHLLSPNGDKSYVYDWLVTTGVLAGGAGLDILAGRFPVVSAVIGMLAAVEKHAGLRPALMGRNEQVVDPSPVAEFSYAGDGTVGGHLTNLAEVGEHGDIAVSRIEKGEDEPVYALYLPGAELEGLDVGRGRSPMSLLDGLDNDSHHMVSAVEEVLEASGVPEGATVLPIGFSMGGLHVLNMVNNKSLNEKYHIPSAATISAPGQNKRVNTDVKLTHFADGRDPVPHILGDRHQESSERLSIVYNFQNPDSEIGSVMGSAHTLEHNVDAITLIEDAPLEWLSEQEVEHLDSLREHLDGKVSTAVFSTRWRQQADPDHLLPWEAEGFDDLQYLEEAVQEGLREGRGLTRRLPGRGQAPTSPGTVDWEIADTTGTLLHPE